MGQKFIEDSFLIANIYIIIMIITHINLHYCEDYQCNSFE